MNFEDFKNVIKELAEKKYIDCLHSDDHIIVQYRNHRDKDFEDEIKRQIEILWDCVNEVKGTAKHFKYDIGLKVHIGTAYVRTGALIDAINESTNYEQMVKKVQDLELSYLQKVRKIEGGINSELSILITDAPYKTRIDKRDYGEDIRNAIKNSFPETMRYNTNGRRTITVKTYAAIEWEKKKQCCKEIKFQEDLEEIFLKYDIIN